MNEAGYKRELVKQFQKLGHYAHRVEDAYSVGFPDLILIPKGYPTFFCEAKIVRGVSFGPSARQKIELDRLSVSRKYAIPCILGFQHNEMYLHQVADSAKITESVKKADDETVVQFFQRFYHERMEI